MLRVIDNTCELASVLAYKSHFVWLHFRSISSYSLTLSPKSVTARKLKKWNSQAPSSPSSCLSLLQAGKLSTRMNASTVPASTATPMSHAEISTATASEGFHPFLGDQKMEPQGAASLYTRTTTASDAGDARKNFVDVVNTMSTSTWILTASIVEEGISGVWLWKMRTFCCRISEGEANIPGDCMGEEALSSV